MKAIVVGASGYAGGDLVRILARHGKVDEVEASSRAHEGRPVSGVHQNLRGIYDKRFVPFDSSKADADVVFLAVPHGQAMEHVPKLLERGIKVVDLSADYRISDQALYEKYYVKHRSPELLKEAAYGLPELFRERIRKARLVANPGCYTTAAILSLAPMGAFKDRIDASKVVVDAKSGTSGAGTKAETVYMHTEADESMRIYKAVGHRHQPEIEHVLKAIVPNISVSFTPTLVPMIRGILSNAHVFGDLEGVDLRKHYERFYSKEAFVRVVEESYTKNVTHSNYCDISVFYDAEKKRAVLVSAIDNLIKGAAGQAVQNMNLMFGYDEAEGIDSPPYHP
ncbi:MAG: N-acetyl-gamma-glutamyl-phosphate reductase [Candidatus Altiarchaeota archaeon]